jgi:hypothetical protein
MNRIALSAGSAGSAVSAIAVVLGAFSLLGCTDDSEGDAPQDEATCKVPGDYAALGAITGNANANANGDPTIALTIAAGPPRDVLQVRLTAGAGAFAGGLATGTFSIGGADASFTGCGLCLTIIADIVAGVGPTKFYQATAGTVTITSTARPYAGTVADLSFGEVTIDGTPVPGCKTEIASASFTSN